MLNDATATRNYLFDIWDQHTISRVESIYVVLVDHNRTVIHAQQMATGNETSCSLYTHQVLRLALRYGAAGIILAHNHPGVNHAVPSQPDIDTTMDLFIKAECIGIKLIDHIIITPGGAWVSMERLGHFETYNNAYSQAINVSKRGTFEHTALTLLCRIFTQVIDKSSSKDYAFARLYEGLDKVYTKFFEPII